MLSNVYLSLIFAYISRFLLVYKINSIQSVCEWQRCVQHRAMAQALHEVIILNLFDVLLITNKHKQNIRLHLYKFSFSYR